MTSLCGGWLYTEIVYLTAQSPIRVVTGVSVEQLPVVVVVFVVVSHQTMAQFTKVFHYTLKMYFCTNLCHQSQTAGMLLTTYMHYLTAF